MAYDYPIDPQFQIASKIILAIYGLTALWGLVSYILGSFGHYRIAKRRGIHHAWLAWIPIGKSWILGCISDQYRYIARNENTHRRTVLLILSIVTKLLGGASGVLGVLNGMGVLANLADANDAAILRILAAVAIPSLIGAVCGLVMLIFTYISYYDLYLSCTPDNCVLFLVLSILFPVTIPFFVFAVRNKDGGMPPRKGYDIPGQPQWHPGRENEM